VLLSLLASKLPFSSRIMADINNRYEYCAPHRSSSTGRFDTRRLEDDDERFTSRSSSPGHVVSDEGLQRWSGDFSLRRGSHHPTRSHHLAGPSASDFRPRGSPVPQNYAPSPAYIPEGKLDEVLRGKSNAIKVLLTSHVSLCGM
jgi:hypothetical protein